jgi:hypothetical protein
MIKLLPTMRLLFIPGDNSDFYPTGDLLEIYLCKDCGTHKEFKDNFCMIAYPRYPRTELGTPDECFICSKHFDGDTPATNVVIELTKPAKKEK